MCRSIKPLRLPDRLASQEEISEAALQYVRKVSGYRKPSQANQAAFDTAVAEIAAATSRMLKSLTVRSSKPPARIRVRLPPAQPIPVLP